MKALEISRKSALEAYKNADSKGKELLEHLFGSGIFSAKVTDRVKTLEDAFDETGRPETPEFSEVPEELRGYFKSHYNACVVTEALNEGWVPDYKDSSQRKWIPWFSVSSSGFAFNATNYDYSNPYAGRAARLCFKSEELAVYAGKQFKDIYEEIIMK